MKRTALVLMTVLMLAALDGGNVKPGLAQTENDCLLLEISGASGRSVCENNWFARWTWTAPATGPVTFDTEGSDFDLLLTVLELDGTFQGEMRLSAQQSQEYNIFARRTNDSIDPGTIVLNWRPSSSDAGRSVSNGDFGSSVAISGASGQSTGSNIGAGKESGEPDHAGNSGGASVWWTWTAPATGAAMFDTRVSDFDTLLAIYTGNNLDRLAEVASNDDASEGDHQSAVRFLVQQGQTYHVAVDGHDGRTGAIVLNWQPVPVPEILIASVAVSIPGPDGLTAVGRDVNWVAPAPEVDGLTRGWNRNRNDNGDLHGLQIHVDGTNIVVEQWLGGVRQATASYRDGRPFGDFSSYADGELEGVQYDVGEHGWSFETYRDGTPHGPFGSYVDGVPEGDFGTLSDDEVEGILHTIDDEGWSFEVYRDGTRHGPYGTYNADGQKDGPFGIYTNGRKNPGEVYWANDEREPGAENRPPLPIPSNVPEEITFDPDPFSLDSLSLGWPNLFFWEPDGDTLEYFISSEPPGMFDTFSDGSVVASSMSLNDSVSPGTSGRATVMACDRDKLYPRGTEWIPHPERLCSEITFKVLVQPEFTRTAPGNFSVEAPYCKRPLVFDAKPVTEVEICARDLDYEDGDRIVLKLVGDGVIDYDYPYLCEDDACLDFNPLRTSSSCKTVQVQGSFVDLWYYLEGHSEQHNWWDWDWITESLCQAGWSPDCFVGPELWSHPGTEVNRGELIVKSKIDSETREWEMEGWGAARSEGTIRIRAVGLEPEDHRCAEDAGTDEQAETRSESPPRGACSRQADYHVYPFVCSGYVEWKRNDATTCHFVAEEARTLETAQDFLEDSVQLIRQAIQQTDETELLKLIGLDTSFEDWIRRAIQRNDEIEYITFHPGKPFHSRALEPPPSACPYRSERWKCEHAWFSNSSSVTCGVDIEWGRDDKTYCTHEFVGDPIMDKAQEELEDRIRERQEQLQRNDDTDFIAFHPALPGAGVCDGISCSRSDLSDCR